VPRELYTANMTDEIMNDINAAGSANEQQETLRNKANAPKKKSPEFMTFFLLRARVAYASNKNFPQNTPIELLTLMKTVIPKAQEFLGRKDHPEKDSAIYEPYCTAAKAMLQYSVAETFTDNGKTKSNSISFIENGPYDAKHWEMVQYILSEKKKRDPLNRIYAYTDFLVEQRLCKFYEMINKDRGCKTANMGDNGQFLYIDRNTWSIRQYFGPYFFPEFKRHRRIIPEAARFNACQYKGIEEPSPS